MAANRKFQDSRHLSVTVSDPTTPAAGDPVRWGDRVGVAEKDERADGVTEVDFGGAYDLSVKGVNDGGNSAVVPGDSIYYVDADTPKLSKKVTGGTFYGFAMEAVDAGATATITVATR